MAASPAAGEPGLAWSLVGDGWTRQRLAVERKAASEGGVSSFCFGLTGACLVQHWSAVKLDWTHRQSDAY